MEKGFFQLKTPLDLLAKLEGELKNLRRDPSNPWIAFNFFVTAEHLPDWIGDKSVRRKNTLLRVCSHLANGGKHFIADHKRHFSVNSAVRDGVFEEGVFEKGVCEEWLDIILEPKEAKELGVLKIDAVSLSEQILSWWRQHLYQRMKKKHKTKDDRKLV